MSDPFKKMLVLAWINAQSDQRAEYLKELERQAALSNVNLFREVLDMIESIAEAETARLASDDYYANHSLYGQDMINGGATTFSCPSLTRLAEIDYQLTALGV